MSSPDLTGMRQLEESLKTQFADLLERGPEISRRAREVETTETSPDGLITVTVDARGNLVRLDLDPRIYRRPDSRELADTILETIQKATAAAKEAVLDVMEELMPRDRARLNMDGDPEAILNDISAQMKQIGQ